MAKYKQIKVRPNQTIFDIALREYGSIEGVFELLQNNVDLENFDVVLVEAADINILPGVVYDDDVLQFYIAKGIHPASSQTLPPIDGGVPPPPTCSPVQINDYSGDPFDDGAHPDGLYPSGNVVNLPPTMVRRRNVPLTTTDLEALLVGEEFIVELTDIFDNDLVSQGKHEYGDTLIIAADIVQVSNTLLGPNTTVVVLAPINIYDVDDNIVATVDQNQAVKINGAYDSITTTAVDGKAAKTINFAGGGAPSLKPKSIAFAPPTGTVPFSTGDFIDLYNAGVYDFYLGNDGDNHRKLGADNYTLDASTPNPFDTLDRYTALDGSGPTTPGMMSFTFPVGAEYLVVDWLHDVMMSQANLGFRSWEDSLTDIAALNTAMFKGFNGWMMPTSELITLCGMPDQTTPYYDNPNLFRRGVVSGQSENSVWLARVAEASTTNARMFNGSADVRRTARTSSSLIATYPFRFVQPTDSFLP